MTTKKRGLALWAIPEPPSDFLPVTTQLFSFRKCDSVLICPGKHFFNVFPSGVILKKEIGYLCPLVCILFLPRFWQRYDVFSHCCGKQSVRWALKKVDHRWINIEKSSKWELHSLLHRIGCELWDKRRLDAKVSCMMFVHGSAYFLSELHPFPPPPTTAQEVKFQPMW